MACVCYACFTYLCLADFRILLYLPTYLCPPVCFDLSLSEFFLFTWFVHLPYLELLCLSVFVWPPLVWPVLWCLWLLVSLCFDASVCNSPAVLLASPHSIVQRPVQIDWLLLPVVPAAGKSLVLSCSSRRRRAVPRESPSPQPEAPEFTPSLTSSVLLWYQRVRAI